MRSVRSSSGDGCTRPRGSCGTPGTGGGGARSGDAPGVGAGGAGGCGSGASGRAAAPGTGAGARGCGTTGAACPGTGCRGAAGRRPPGHDGGGGRAGARGGCWRGGGDHVRGAGLRGGEPGGGGGGGLWRGVRGAGARGCGAGGRYRSPRGTGGGGGGGGVSARADDVPMPTLPLTTTIRHAAHSSHAMRRRHARIGVLQWSAAGPPRTMLPPESPNGRTGTVVRYAPAAARSPRPARAGVIVEAPRGRSERARTRLARHTAMVSGPGDSKSIPVSSVRHQDRTAP